MHDVANDLSPVWSSGFIRSGLRVYQDLEHGPHGDRAAVDHQRGGSALDKIDFRAFRGHTVYVDDRYVECLDKQYVIASVRHRILHQGAIIVQKPEDAEVLVEMRTGVVGTDIAESFVGVPEITLPGC